MDPDAQKRFEAVSKGKRLASRKTVQHATQPELGMNESHEMSYERSSAEPRDVQ